MRLMKASRIFKAIATMDTQVVLRERVMQLAPHTQKVEYAVHYYTPQNDAYHTGHYGASLYAALEEFSRRTLKCENFSLEFKPMQTVVDFLYEVRSHLRGKPLDTLQLQLSKSDMIDAFDEVLETLETVGGL